MKFIVYSRSKSAINSPLSASDLAELLFINRQLAKEAEVNQHFSKLVFASKHEKMIMQAVV